MSFFVNDTATPKIYTYLHTLSLHDALPILTGCTSADLLIGGISLMTANVAAFHRQYAFQRIEHRFSTPEASACQSGNFLSHMPAFADMSIRIDRAARHRDRKSTRLNSSH